jgi:hypothetical protein
MIFFHRVLLNLLILLPVSAFCSSWSLEELSVKNSDGSFNLQAQSLLIPPFNEQITRINYTCKGSYEVYPIHHCENGQVSFFYENYFYDLFVSGWMDFSSESWELTFENKPRTIKITTDSRKENEIHVQLKQIKMEDLSDIWKQLPSLISLPTDGQISANIDVNFQNKLDVNCDFQIENLSWESEDYIFAQTSHKGNVHLQQTLNGFNVVLTNKIFKGESLLKDMYVLFDKYPIEMTSSSVFDNAFELVKSQVSLLATKAVSLDVSIKDGSFENLLIDFDISDLEHLYKGFLSSYVEIKGIDDLLISGQSKGQLLVENAKITQASINMLGTNVDIESKKIKLKNLTADLNWHIEGEWLSSKLQWDNILLAGMPIKQSEMNLKSVGQQIKVQNNTILPLFDGSILINELWLQDLFSPEISIDFDGELKPISIALITKKMGWPKMNGVISGKIPGMKKKGQSIKFDGFLDLNVFEGTMQISNLSIERLFGIAPVIAANVDFNLLNLQQITSTFDFGEITGLIDGYVKGLRITNWKVDRLDAYVHSVKTKGIKQTISQRAIDNISSIGGIQGALSRSFLRFFDYFNYKRIGIGCKLRNAICEMSGLNEVNESYQLIEGKGLPSINILGFSRYIDWELFLDRLLNAGY